MRSVEQGETEAGIHRLEFSELGVGDVLRVTTGQGHEAWTYHFEITDTSSKWPDTTMTAFNPEGEKAGKAIFSMHGCGRWTTRQENPVQDQERAFTPYYDGLILGSFLWGRLEGYTERIVMDKAGQEISNIEILRSA